MGRIPTKHPITALVSDQSNPQTLYASSMDGVFKSQDAGKNWYTVTTRLDNSSVATLALEPGQPMHLYAITASGQLYVSTDAAASWQVRGHLPFE